MVLNVTLNHLNLELTTNQLLVNLVSSSLSAGYNAVWWIAQRGRSDMNGRWTGVQQCATPFPARLLAGTFCQGAEGAANLRFQEVQEILRPILPCP